MPRGAMCVQELDDSRWLQFTLVNHSNDPSAGSPTETLLRLLRPLNDQV
ncbi:hypothetical protein JL09_g6552 [Pichia kudriavzevii]|uniref:Uncharacterized protein n=1 Tax=Pichia kudriavzevii TaxID=4909 RepID=A0A099NQV2_PICKU|nr:hypothetical protein JL09_g6552 [Pichia kudriavzevii]